MWVRLPPRILILQVSVKDAQESHKLLEGVQFPYLLHGLVAQWLTQTAFNREIVSSTLTESTPSYSSVIEQESLKL